MKKSFLLVLFAVLTTALGLKAQVVTTEPSPLWDNSKDVVVYFHADKGNKGLINQPATAQIYAHTGVITTSSTDDTDWQYAPTWGDNAAKYKLEYVSANLWKLNIGDIYKYYDITNPDVVVTKLAFVFRTADNSKEAKDEGNKDIFTEVKTNRLILDLTSTLQGPVVQPGSEKVTFTLTANQPASLTLSIDGKQIASANNTTTLSESYVFPTQGIGYDVVATAKTDSQEKTITQRVFYPAPAQALDYPGGTPVMGQARQADGSVIFCIAAPQKNSVLMLGSWSDFNADSYSPMNYQDYQGNRYFWTKVSGLEADKQYLYYYLVDGTIKVGDPYAKLILDPWNDGYIPADVYPNLPAYPKDKVKDVPLAVYQENINNYTWNVKDFKGVEPHNLVIYELLFRDFTGTEGKADGNGTVRKAIERIPYLKELGVNAVELLPINEFNGNISWGYNPNFYFAPDKAYGTPDDYKEFIDICHQNGIAVILDIVFNQTDWLHPWYQMYPAGQNPFFNADAPHAYSVLNDWNQGNPIVQQQFKDILKYWIKEYNIDGYRFDLVKGLGDNDSYSNNSDAATNAYNASRVARMRELQYAVKQVKPNAYFINENLAGEKEENEMAEFGQLNWANLNYQAQNFAVGTQANSALNRFYAPDDNRLWGSTVSYLESHDEQRLAYVQNQRGGSGIRGNIPVCMRRLGCAAAQMLMAPGAHMIWQFSELGNDQNTKNGNGGNNTDPKIVNWNLLNQPVRKGLYDTYRDLIAIRTRNPQLFEKDVQISIECGDNNWTAGRRITLRKGSQEIYLVVNPTTGNLTVPMSFTNRDNNAYQILAKSYGVEPTFNAELGNVVLPNSSFVVIGSASLAGIDGISNDTDAETVAAYGGQGALIINETGSYSVYNVSGALIHNGNGYANLPLPAGIYLVSNGNATAKVLVK